MRGTWRIPDGALSPLATVRFETHGPAIPLIAYGQPLPGVSIHCQVDRIVSRPKIVDLGGVECEMPDLMNGTYTISLLYDKAHSAHHSVVRLSGRAPYSGPVNKVPMSAIPETRLESLQPNTGPVAGGTLVTVSFKKATLQLQ